MSSETNSFVLKQSKHIVNVFKEAKVAYREKKAELRAARDETDRGKFSHDTRPPVERGYTDSYYTNDANQQIGNRSSNLRPNYSSEESELLRRNSDSDVRSLQTVRRKPMPSTYHEDIDMGLAYGELPPPLPPRRYNEGGELRSRMNALNRVLEDANCMHHSASQIIKSLETNPEAMAAVALSLAEISNLMTKMAPGALMSMKGAFPAIIALLLSPEFLIAVGVGLGVTVVALGGYKIVKKIKAARGKDKEVREGVLETDELEEVTADVSKVESWRRGMPFAEDAGSVGTSVEGEFMTPGAAESLREFRSQRTLMPSDGTTGQEDKIWRKGRGEGEKEKMAKAKNGKKAKAEKEKEKESEPSGLRLLFKKRDLVEN